MKKMTIIIALCIVFLIFSFGLRERKEENFIKNVQNQYKIMKIGEKAINIQVLDTEEERMKGLSGRPILEENLGFLFIFDKEDYHGIWMKDMNFPIDIAWLDKDKKIIHIEKNVSPDTYPKVFYSFRDGVWTESLYVLETNANFFENSKIKIGDLTEF